MRWQLAAGMALSSAGVLVAGATIVPGGLDSRFGRDGVVSTATAPADGFDFQNGLAIQRDGKILVGGESDLGVARGGFQWRITRYTRSGAEDSSFGEGGTVLTSVSDVGGFDERLVSLAVQRDGKIVAAGWAETAPGIQDSVLVRYHATGALDPTFGDGGTVITNVASEPDHDFINDVVIDADDRIVVAGGCRRVFVGRYLADGSLDPSFNPHGPRPGLTLSEVAPANEVNSEILSITMDAEGRIVGGGYSTFVDDGSRKVHSAVIRFLSDGTLDGSLNAQGPRPGTIITAMAPNAGWNVIFRVTLDRSDRIVTVGDAFVGVGAGLFDIALARYLPDGQLDASFGEDGVVLTNLAPGDSDDDAQGLAIQPNGLILVGGSAAPTAFLIDSDFMVARFQSDGTLDASFGNGGIAITQTAPGKADDEIVAVALQGARLIASGACDQAATGRDACVVRYHLEGARGPR